MEQNQRDILINILTRYKELALQNLAMQALLEIVQRHGAFRNFAGDGLDSTWKAEIDLLTSGPTRQKVEAEFAPVLQQIEQAFQDSELRQLLAKIPVKGPVN